MAACTAAPVVATHMATQTRARQGTGVHGRCIAVSLDAGGATVEVHPCSCPLCIEGQEAQGAQDGTWLAAQDGGDWSDDRDDPSNDVSHAFALYLDVGEAVEARFARSSRNARPRRGQGGKEVSRHDKLKRGKARYRSRKIETLKARQRGKRTKLPAASPLPPPVSPVSPACLPACLSFSVLFSLSLCVSLTHARNTVFGWKTRSVLREPPHAVGRRAGRCGGRHRRRGRRPDTR